MQIELTTLLDRLFELIPNGLNRGLSDIQIETVERYWGVRLPDDVRELYSRTNGTHEATHPDNGWTTFWSADRWDWVAAISPADSASFTSALVIADHCLSSWSFALELAPAEAYGSIHIVDGRGSPVRVAGSFTEFLKLVLDDDERIYPPSSP